MGRQNYLSKLGHSMGERDGHHEACEGSVLRSTCISPISLWTLLPGVREALRIALCSFCPKQPCPHTCQTFLLGMCRSAAQWPSDDLSQVGPNTVTIGSQGGLVDISSPHPFS